jgi:hypothetical protein
MTRKRDDVVDALARKGFRKEGGDHEFFIYWNLKGKKTIRKTKVSRGSSYRDISDDLLSKMAKQVGVTKKSFLDLIDCTLDQIGYERQAFPPHSSSP